MTSSLLRGIRGRLRKDQCQKGSCGPASQATFEAVFIPHQSFLSNMEFMVSCSADQHAGEHVELNSSSGTATWPGQHGEGGSQPTMQGLICLDHLGHEHGSLAGDVGKGAQGCGQVDGGDGRVYHELQQLLQGCLAFFPQDI